MVVNGGFHDGFFNRSFQNNVNPIIMTFSKLLSLPKVEYFDFFRQNAIKVHVLGCIFTYEIIMKMYLVAIQESVDFILLRDCNIRHLIFRRSQLVEHSLAEDVCDLLDALFIQKTIHKNLGYFLVALVSFKKVIFYHLIFVIKLRSLYH